MQQTLEFIGAVSPAERLCLALDVQSRAKAIEWIERTGGLIGTYKVGLELFCAEGPDVVRACLTAGAPRVFLDLKLHDIPATVAGTVRRLRDTGATMLSLHVAGGQSMIQRAVEAADGAIQLVGVTTLTSLDAADLAADGHVDTPADLVERRAAAAVRSGLRALVASPQEVALLRRAYGSVLTLIVPGVSLDGAPRGDQRRVATPAQAARDGADLLVIGRPIRDAQDPIAVIRALHRAVAPCGLEQAG